MRKRQGDFLPCIAYQHLGKPSRRPGTKRNTLGTGSCTQASLPHIFWHAPHSGTAAMSSLHCCCSLRTLNRVKTCLSSQDCLASLSVLCYGVLLVWELPAAHILLARDENASKSHLLAEVRFWDLSGSGTPGAPLTKHCQKRQQTPAPKTSPARSRQNTTTSTPKTPAPQPLFKHHQKQSTATRTPSQNTTTNVHTGLITKASVSQLKLLLL